MAAMPAAPAFTDRTLRFLRALKRNNRREWFHDRRAEYDAHVDAPLAAVVAALAVDLPRVAPDFVADPKASRFRIFRDTRFSADKTPLKTHIAAIFPQRALGRLRGAGLYFEIGPGYVWIGGGLYAPDPASLHAVRSHLAARHGRLRKILAAPAFIETFGTMSGEQAPRMPRGFDPAHPAADLIQRRQFLAVREEPDAFAVRDNFYPQLLGTFTAMAPFVRFINEPLVALKQAADADPLIAERRAPKSRIQR
jgi:uncharacterized protein (TIGR02453 family)